MACFLVVLFFASLIAVSASKLTVESSKPSHWETVEHLSYNLMKEENVKAHNSKLFRRVPGLHVRHDVEFQLALKLHKRCDRPFEFQLLENGDSIFTWSKNPLVKDGELHFHLYVNRSIPVGQYNLITSDPCSDEKHKKKLRITVVNVLFNPTSAQLDKRNVDVLTSEYINNNCGYIWTGDVAIPWDYAVGSLTTTRSKNDLMEMMSTSERSNPVLYSRALTRLIGSNVLYGSWDGDYEDGVEPTQWVGSVDILARWRRYGEQVKYGQCWVFAGLLTTLLRASGIPARTVTNFGSHHDRGLTDDETQVLRAYDNIVQDDEGTWNFHVWSEAWLERPDLGKPADWNAVDATPQEPSPLAPNNPYQAGPAYVPNIRGNIRAADYDTLFILAEVNAVKVCPTTGRVLSQDVGYAVVTKKPGMSPQVYDYYNFELITSSYKIPSKKRAIEDTDVVLPPPYIGCERDGGMRVNVTPPRPSVGEDFRVIVTEGNVSAEDTVIRFELRNYMGESLGIISEFMGMKVLDVTEKMDYLPYLRNSSIFRFSIGEYNELGDFIFHDAIRIRLTYEEIAVEAVKDPNSTNITVTITYINPLSVPMTGVVINIASPDNNYIRLEEEEIPANSPFTTTTVVDCGDHEGDIMIPISLDSEETQSAYGLGWSNCGEGEQGGSTPLGISMLQIMLLSVIMTTFYI